MPPLTSRKSKPFKLAATWDQLGEIMADAARRLERGGADCILICANTMHRCVPQIEAAVRIPRFDITDAAADAIHRAKVSTVGLLETRYTMEGDFFRGRLAEKHGITALIPPAEMRNAILHRLIYDELTKGIFKDSSRRCFVAAIEWLQAQGSEGVILGCTEIPLLVKPEHAVHSPVRHNCHPREGSSRFRAFVATDYEGSRPRLPPDVPAPELLMIVPCPLPLQSCIPV